MERFTNLNLLPATNRDICENFHEINALWSLQLLIKGQSYWKNYLIGQNYARTQVLYSNLQNTNCHIRFPNIPEK